MLKGMNSCNIININNHVINIKKNERWYQQSFGRVKHCWATKELNLNVCLQSNMHELAWIYRSKNLTLRDKKSLIKCAFSLSLKSQFILLFSLFFLLGPTALFDTIHGSHCTISANFYLYLQYFQQKVFNFSKIISISAK